MQKKRKSALDSSSGMSGAFYEPDASKVRKKAAKKKKREGPLQNDEAATIIQKAWRRHIVNILFKCKTFK